MKNNRNLNMTYAIEALNSRINGSANQVENNNTGFGNITFTKKINGKGYVSPSCCKSGMKEFMKNEGYEVSSYKKDGSKIISSAHPYKYINENIFGMMMADKEQITKEEYDDLADDMKKLYGPSKKKGMYERNVTKKREAVFQMNGLIGVGTSKVNKEWGVCVTNEGGNMPYVLETYSDILVGIANFNISKVGEFIISDNELEFRDYSIEEAERLGVTNLPREEKLRQIETTLRSLQYLSIKTNQSNYLTDTMPKIIIMGEYSYGNNVFQGLINKNGINIDGLIEVIEEFDSFRLSDIWIGISSKIMNDNFQGLKEKLKEELGKYDFIKIGSVGNAFDGYIDYLKETL